MDGWDFEDTSWMWGGHDDPTLPPGDWPDNPDRLPSVTTTAPPPEGDDFDTLYLTFYYYGILPGDVLLPVAYGGGDGGSGGDGGESDNCDVVDNNPIITPALNPPSVPAPMVGMPLNIPTVTVDAGLQIDTTYVTEALLLIQAMESMGILDDVSRASVSAITGIRISGDNSGFDEATGIFNINASTLQLIVDQTKGDSYLQNLQTTSFGFGVDFATLVIAGMIVHDGYHGVQTEAGFGTWTLFPGNPVENFRNGVNGAIDTDAEIDLLFQLVNYRNHVIQHERQANMAQSDFFASLQGLVDQNTLDTLIDNLATLTDQEILGRVNRPPGSDSQGSGSNSSDPHTDTSTCGGSS